MVSTTMKRIETDRGERLQLARTIQGSSDDAWSTLANVSHWPEWGPLLTDVQYPYRDVREDTTGSVQLMKCFWVSFQIQTVEEYYWTWSVMGVTPPSDGHRVEPLGEEVCRVSFELPIWGMPYLPVCYFALRRIERSLEAAGY